MVLGKEMDSEVRRQDQIGLVEEEAEKTLRPARLGMFHPVSMFISVTSRSMT